MSTAQRGGDEPAPRCPHPGCDATLPAAGPGEELRLCPGCGRASCRCVRENRGVRCPALNHPLARFCRRCGIELGVEWPHALWAGEAADRPGGGADDSIFLGPAEVIYDFDGNTRLTKANASAPRLVEAAGQLWVAWGDGRTLLRINPGPISGATPTCDLDRLPDGEGSSPTRLRASGPWMTVTSGSGIHAIDLIGIDDLGDQEPWCRPLWKPAKGEALAAGPIFLPSRDDPMGRVVLWVIAGSEGSSLGVAQLPGPSPDRPAVHIHPFLAQGGPMPALDADGPGAALIASHDGAGPLVLAVREGLYVVEAPSPGGGSPAVLRRFWDRPPPLSEWSGVVVVPGEVGADGKLRPAHVFAAGRDAEGPAMAILRPEPGYPPIPVRGAHLPVTVVRRPMASSVLALDGSSLALIGTDGNVTRVAEAPALASAREIVSHGRLALASGEESGNASIWFAITVDMATGRLMSAGTGADGPKLVSTRPATGLVPLGRYLYRVAESGLGRLALLRYEIQFGKNS